MILLELFFSFCQVGLFSFGGGYAAIPLIQNQVVDIHGWITMKQFADIITISQMTPGPIGINCATFVGLRVGGIPGAIIATFGCVLPPVSISITLAVLYKKYKDLTYVQGVLKVLRPAIIGMIASAAFSIILHAVMPEGTGFLLRGVDWISVALMAGSFTLIRKTKLDPIIIMLIVGAVGGVVYSVL